MEKLKRAIPSILFLVTFLFAIIFINVKSPIQIAQAAEAKPVIPINQKIIYLGFPNQKIEIRNLSKNAIIEFKSSNSKIVKVTKNGTITPIAEGKAYIKVTIKQAGKRYTSKINITVKIHKASITDDSGLVYRVYGKADQTYRIRIIGLEEAKLAYDGKLNIPNSIHGIKVEAINSGALIGYRKLKEVLISNGIVLEDSIFRDCSALTKVKLPEDLSEIPDYSFYNCTSLSEIKLPKGINKIGVSSFGGCKSLTKLVFPEGLTEIAKAAFKNTSIREIVMPNSLRELGEEAFCFSVLTEKIVFSENLTSIPKNCFIGLGANEIYLPDNIIRIEETAFSQVKARKIKLPIKLEEIPDNCFAFSHNLKDITIPESVNRIGEAAFYETGLYQVIFETGKLPDDISKQAFKVIDNLSAAYLSGNQELFLEGDRENAYKAFSVMYKVIIEAQGLPNDYEKVKFVHDWLCKNVTYSIEYNTDIYGVFVNGYANCYSYAKAFISILTCLNIPCIEVSSIDMNHSWNLVYLNGEWYHVDVTWDDYDNINGISVDYKYFLKSDEYMQRLERTWDTPVFTYTSLIYTEELGEPIGDSKLYD